MPTITQQDAVTNTQLAFEIAVRLAVGFGIGASYLSPVVVAAIGVESTLWASEGLIFAITFVFFLSVPDESPVTTAEVDKWNWRAFLYL